MSRFRMYPTPDQHARMLEFNAHARFVWNLCVEQESFYRRGGPKPPTHKQRSIQLTEVRTEHIWLREGSVTVQQQAIRDFDQAMRNYFSRSHSQPTWRRKGLDEGFRIVGAAAQRVHSVNRKWAIVDVPKVGKVKFRLSRPMPGGHKSYRVTLDRGGRWHVAFAVVPATIEAPGNGEMVGVDRGVKRALALSDGTFYDFARPDLDAKVRRLQRRLSRCQRGSNRRAQAKARLAKAQAKRADARKDFVEKASTDIARRFDFARLENLKVANMTRSAKGTIDAPGVNVAAKAALNRVILDKGWTAFARRLSFKMQDRVEFVPAAYTSLGCSSCGHVAKENRKSQADFLCVACGFAENADTNAARNIAAGRAVTARGGDRVTGPVNREPQLLRSA